MFQSVKCPNCGSPYNPASFKCEYCGSFILSDVESTSLSQKIVDEISAQINAAGNNNDISFPGIYYAGTLLGKGEVPIKFKDAFYFEEGAKIKIIGKTKIAIGKFLLTKEHIYFTAPPYKMGALTKAVNNVIGGFKYNKEKVDVFIPLTDVIETKIDCWNQFHVLTNEKFYYFTISNAQDMVSEIMLAALNAKNRVNNVPSSNVKSKPTNLSYTTELIQLKELMDAGVITEEEFIIKKRKLLGI